MACTSFLVTGILVSKPVHGTKTRFYFTITKAPTLHLMYLQKILSYLITIRAEIPSRRVAL